MSKRPLNLTGRKAPQKSVETFWARQNSQQVWGSPGTLGPLRDLQGLVAFREQEHDLIGCGPEGDSIGPSVTKSAQEVQRSVNKRNSSWGQKVALRHSHISSPKSPSHPEGGIIGEWTIHFNWHFLRPSVPILGLGMGSGYGSEEDQSLSLEVL